MGRVIRDKDLPRLRSTRDQRARVDLFTADLFGTDVLKADRITYEPGDTAAAHYHEDCKHVFFVTEGRGELRGAEGEPVEPLAAGDVALVEEGEVHWFANPHQERFSFIELWVPTPSKTVWVDAGDV
jgi:quercetin dioxygenase-like cupin family protein